MLIVGIAGGSSSGKSTITSLIKRKFGDDVSVMLHDDYYKARHELSYDERVLLNYDAPEAFDTGLMAEHISMLRAGETIRCPVYDFTIYDRTDSFTEIKPTKVLVIDGILVLAEPELRELMDIKIFVDTDADIRVLRRIKRDVNKRGRTIESVTRQYLETVKPMHEMYVEPSKRFADIIIPEGGHNVVAMEMLENRIASYLEK